MTVLSVVGVGLLGTLGCGPPAPATTLTTLKRDVFEPRCGATACHGGANPARGLNLVVDPHAALVGVPTVVDPERRYVVAGDPGASVLWTVLQEPVPSPDGNNDCRQMPPGFALPAETVQEVEAWIAEGALDD